MIAKIRHVLIVSFFCSFTLSFFSQKLESERHFIHKSEGKYRLGTIDSIYNDFVPCDTIFHIGNEYFATKKDSINFNIINSQLNEIVKGIRNIRSVFNCIIWDENKGTRIFDGRTISPLYDSVSISLHYGIIFKNGKQGIHNLKEPLNKIIDPEHDKIGPYYEGFLVINNNKLGWISEKNEIPITFSHIYKVRPKILAAKNNSGITYYFSDKKGQLLNTPNDSVVFYDLHYKIVRGNHQIIYDFNNVKLSEIKNLEIHPFYSESKNADVHYSIVSNGEKCALYKNNSITSPFKFDNFLSSNNQLNSGYIKVEVDLHVGIVDEAGEFILQPNYANVITQIDNYFIVEENQKFGLVTKGDSIILPIEFTYISLINNYAIVSKTSDLQLGVVNLNNGELVAPYRYVDFKFSNNYFVAFLSKTSTNVYHNDSLKLMAMENFIFTDKVFKGYKDNKVHIAYIDNNVWELSVYSIPIYQNDNLKKVDIPSKTYNPSDSQTIYDFKSGKWGMYSYNQHKWSVSPQTHSGDEIDGIRLLNYAIDTLVNWQGINFSAIKRMPFVSTNSKSKHFWIDNHRYNYTIENTNNLRRDNSLGNLYYDNIASSKINNTSLKGVGYVNAGFYKNQNVSSLIVDGSIEISKTGDLLLSEYLCNISLQGGAHPFSIEDYEKVIDLNQFISFKNQKEHLVLSVSFFNKNWITINYSFDWLDKNLQSPYIFQLNGYYGLISDTTSLLVNEMDTIYREGYYHITGKRSNNHKLMDVRNDSILAIYENLIEIKDNLYLIKNKEGIYQVYNERLNNLANSTSKIQLLGGNEYLIVSNDTSFIYKDSSLIFKHTYTQTTKINSQFYYVKSSEKASILSNEGNNLLLVNPSENLSFSQYFIIQSQDEFKIVYDKFGKRIYSFESKKYTNLKSGSLLIEEDNQVVLLSDGLVTKYKGKLQDYNSNCFFINNDKTITIMDYFGNQLVSKVNKVWNVEDGFLVYLKGKDYILFDILTDNKIQIANQGVEIIGDKLYYTDKEKVQQYIDLEKRNQNTIKLDSYRNRYGLIENSIELLPKNNYSIKPFSKYHFIQDQLEFKVFDANDILFLTTEVFDKIIPYQNMFIGIKDNKIYYFDESGILFEPN